MDKLKFNILAQIAFLCCITLHFNAFGQEDEDLNFEHFDHNLKGLNQLNVFTLTYNNGIRIADFTQLNNEFKTSSIADLSSKLLDFGLGMEYFYKSHMFRFGIDLFFSIENNVEDNLALAKGIGTNFNLNYGYAITKYPVLIIPYVGYTRSAFTVDIVDNSDYDNLTDLVISRESVSFNSLTDAIGTGINIIIDNDHEFLLTGIDIGYGFGINNKFLKNGVVIPSNININPVGFSARIALKFFLGDR
ncbi:MAG: hypothetical protein ACQETL_19635 [Bacteroidota bacterium]